MEEELACLLGTFVVGRFAEFNVKGQVERKLDLLFAGIGAMPMVQIERQTIGIRNNLFAAVNGRFYHLRTRRFIGINVDKEI